MFDPGLSGATITLSNTLTINTNLTIDASALSGGLQINGNGTVTVFKVASTTITVFLNSLTITNGYTATNSADFYVGGGGILNDGTLTLTNCTLSGNSATDDGGGIYNDGALSLNQCILSGNSASDGGGIWNGWLLTMNQCTLSGNNGGGVHNQAGTLTLNQCTLSGNIASDGGAGGIGNYGNSILTLNNCTLSGNSAEWGGGVYNEEGAMTLNECTLSGNSATYDSGGIGNFGGDIEAILKMNQCTLSGNSTTDGGYHGGIDNYGSTLALTNCILSGNSDIYGDGDIDNSHAAVTYGGSNLVQSVSVYGPSSFTGPAPLTNAPDLAPLGNYGGPTQTIPPLPGSSAIGAGSVAANTFATDQRGYPRTQNGLIDLGAVELQSPAANAPVLENITVPAGGGNGLQFTFTNAPAADFTVLTATNMSLALTNWTVLGEVWQVAPGQYQFTDPQPATNLARFYRVRSP